MPGAEVLVKGENVGTGGYADEIGIGRVELQIIAPGYEVLSLAVEGSWAVASSKFAWLRRLAGLSSMRWR